MNYDEALAAQSDIRHANEQNRTGLIEKLRNVRRNLAPIMADLVSLKQKADSNAENSNHQPPLPPMPEAD
jgi:hypothetical protein